MDETQKQAALSAVRTLLGVVGGYFVGKGFATEETVAQVIGAIMALVPLGWGMWNAKRSEEKTKEREAVAVNVGIAVADRTHGVTPPVSVEKAPAVIEAFAPVAGVSTNDGSTGMKVPSV
jgi:hypothetical protein